jgi:hypothetical protein
MVCISYFQLIPTKGLSKNFGILTATESSNVVWNCRLEVIYVALVNSKSYYLSVYFKQVIIPF